MDLRPQSHPSSGKTNLERIQKIPEKVNKMKSITCFTYVTEELFNVDMKLVARMST